MKRLQQDQRGIAQVIIILIVVAVVGAVGFVGWRVMNKDKSTSQDSLIKEAAKAECDKHNDKDLCKFFTSWKDSKKYRMTSTEANGSKSVFEMDGDKSRISMSGEMAYEVITIDKTTYTKAGDTWYKQTIKPQDQDVANDYKADFDDPNESSDAPEESKTTYKSLGKEACGKLTCFKYEVVEPDSPESKQTIWFDDKDYQLRKGRTETAEGASEQTYEYDNVSISVPSPVKELAENQYIVPGQSEPITVPSATDLGQ